ncbi:E3 ubiquitin-protein ligase listerin [Merluccius polli]|uniref:E3 ubiquitin-protein ligase listerin n=1 Tax=Merluccius polli TaxID=89951 RepID=A0AA47NPK9_MERPO|nr:E3 ubiquitin-protein ligase listerin [Merluccius polli]
MGKVYDRSNVITRHLGVAEFIFLQSESTNERPLGKPSSSGRAAELLAREGGVVPGFVGFGSAVTPEPGYVPAVHGAEEIDVLVDADFRLVLRKMSKRDTVTKLKAIQEFGSMCQERDAEEVKGVLPYWPRIYCKISVDHDRRVREATQQAFEQLVLKVRRSLAPFLKSLMGHWLMAQCDTYVPAAGAACLAFAAAFPPNKQPEALSFCRDEILNVLQDTLLKETADTLSDPQCVPEEERETKFIRMVTSSLLGVKKLLHLLPDSDRDVLEDRLTQLISPAKFWKYSKHKTPQVRGALFEVVSALCQYTPGLVHKEAARASSAVLLGIDDTDPVVLPPLWEAVLHVVTTIPDCWTHVNARKGFLPKLWALLREGGGGMAKALHPNLMPLVSKLPQQVTEPALDFYTTFFTSLIQGLVAERAVSSPTESAAIVTAVVECMRFSVLQHTEEGEEQRKIQRMLISQQLLPLLESAVRKPSLQNGPLFLLVTEMLISWEKRAGLHGGDGPQDGPDVFKPLLGDFWEGLGLLLVGFVDTEEADEKALEGVATLLQVMRYPDKVTGRKQANKKKSVKICFSEDAESDGTEGGGPDTALEGEPQQEKAVGSLESERLEEVVCQLAQLCLVYVNEKQSERHLVLLALLLRSFHTPRVFTMLMESEGGEQPSAQQPSPPVVDLKNAAMRFLLERVVGWLSEDGRSHSHHLVDMIFSSLHCCSPQETTRILNHITTANAGPETLKSCRDWLKGSVLGERLLGLAEELCNAGRGHSTSSSNENTHSWTLISLVLSQHHNNEPLIGEVYLEKILEKLHATLSETKARSSHEGGMGPLICFICDVASTFYSSVTDCLLLASAEELLLTAFQITAQDHSNTHLSASVLSKLRGVCVAGVQALVQHSGDQLRESGFLCSAAVWAKRQLLTASLDVKSLQVLVSAVQSVVETLTTSPSQDLTLLTHFLSLLTPSQPEWTRIRQALPPQWMKSPLLSGRLRVTCDYPSIDVWKSTLSSRLPAHLCACALLGRVIQTAAVSRTDQQRADRSLYSELKYTVSELLYAVQWCVEMDVGLATVSQYNSLLTDWGLSGSLPGLVPVQDLLETLYTRSVAEGGLWSLCLERFLQTDTVATGATSNAIRKLYGDPGSWFPVSRAKLSTFQVLCPFMTREERRSVSSLATTGVINWQDNDDVCGCLALLLCCLQEHSPVQVEVLQAVLASMMEWRNSREDWFLFSSDLSKVSAEQLILTVEMMRFLSWLVTSSPSVLGGSQWDFLLCCMLAWLEVR